MRKFYQKQWFTWVMLILIAPAGIYLLWKNKFFSKNASIAISIIFGLFFIGVLTNQDTNTELKNQKNVVDSLMITELPEMSTPIITPAEEHKSTQPPLDKTESIIVTTPIIIPTSAPTIIINLPVITQAPAPTIIVNLPVITQAPAPTIILSEPVISNIVYITKTGAKYHCAGCRYLARSKIPIELSEAVKGYTPCSVCKP